MIANPMAQRLKINEKYNSTPLKFKTDLSGKVQLAYFDSKTLPRQILMVTCRPWQPGLVTAPSGGQQSLLVLEPRCCWICSDQAGYHLQLGKA